MQKRQDAWTPGVQPSVYPSCLAEMENSGSGPAQKTAVLVGPDGAVTGYIGGSDSTTSTGAAPGQTAEPTFPWIVCANEAWFDSRDECLDQCQVGDCTVHRVTKVKGRCMNPN